MVLLGCVLEIISVTIIVTLLVGMNRSTVSDISRWPSSSRRPCPC
ncbi:MULTISPECIES: hypothetical protein [unclassified Xanthobacter]|nr:MULTISPECIES: hypothetical protein [unclassified Xanthobacter]